MRPPRIINRGRIAPKSPSPPSDVSSGRNSFSSASVVSSVPDSEPDQNTVEQACEKLEEPVQASSTKKYALYTMGACALLLLLFAIGFGIGYPLTRSTPLAPTPTPSTTIDTSTATTIMSTTTRTKM
ncbi:unnamed protein product [Adineta steineri]|uniref:Uncharacterized protein n=1 Tax=Adineta steineri TaxID=433720 RepID=A0A815K915_9BILA|nr:unnamed protein product [Adineta steineri]CAF3748589.1 unnamed protein product [Adineta steineri]